MTTVLPKQSHIRNSTAHICDAVAAQTLHRSPWDHTQDGLAKALKTAPNNKVKGCGKFSKTDEVRQVCEFVMAKHIQ